MKKSSGQKSPWRFVFLAMTVLSGAWLGFYAAVQIVPRQMISAGEQAAVGIIGGADGPTAIFVTASSGFDWDPVIAGVLLIVGTAGFCLLRGHRKN